MQTRHRRFYVKLALTIVGYFYTEYERSIPIGKKGSRKDYPKSRVHCLNIMVVLRRENYVCVSPDNSDVRSVTSCAALSSSGLYSSLSSSRSCISVA